VVTALPHDDDPNPFWNSFRILSTSPLANPCFLRVDMYDYDATDSDDHTGFATFDLKALGDFKPANQPVSKDSKQIIHKSSKGWSKVFTPSFLFEPLTAVCMYLRYAYGIH
jgi:Ca2+-dependent lipid-binding protein